VKRGGQDSSLEHGYASSRLYEVKLFEEVDVLDYVETGIKIEQIHAAAQENVLTVVYGFRMPIAGGDLVRGSTAAEVWLSLVKVDCEPGLT